MIQQWCQSTSLDGISDLYQSKDRKSHFIFWIFVMLAMFGLTVYLIVLNINSWISTPTVTKVDTVVEKEMAMPEILLCYKGGLNIAKMKSFGMSKDLIDVLQHSYFAVEPSLDYGLVEKEFSQFLNNKEISVEEFYEQISSYECDDIIVHRKVAGHFDNDIMCANVTVFVSEDTYPCLLLRTNGHQRVTNIIHDGLVLTVTSPTGAQTTDREHFNFTNSFTMALHKTFSVENDGHMEIPLGYKMTILLTLTRIMRLPSSKPCFQNDAKIWQGGSCERTILLNVTIRTCNCTIPGFEVHKTDEHPKICSVFDFRKLCLDKWPSIVEESGHIINANCLIACEEYVYGTSLSFTHLDTLNVSKITIGYSHMQYTKVEEVDAFTWDVAIANVGGQAGLWMGCSVVTIIQTFFYICVCTFSKCRQFTRRAGHNFKK